MNMHKCYSVSVCVETENMAYATFFRFLGKVSACNTEDRVIEHFYHRFIFFSIFVLTFSFIVVISLLFVFYSFVIIGLACPID